MPIKADETDWEAFSYQLNLTNIQLVTLLSLED